MSGRVSQRGDQCDPIDVANHVEFAGAIHGIVHLPHLVHGSLDMLCYWFKTDNVTIVEDHRRLQVFRVAGRTGLLMTYQDSLYLGRQCLTQPVGLGNPQGDARGTAGEYEAYEALWLRQGILESKQTSEGLPPEMH